MESVKWLQVITDINSLFIDLHCGVKSGQMFGGENNNSCCIIVYFFAINQMRTSHKVNTLNQTATFYSIHIVLFETSFIPII